MTRIASSTPEPTPAEPGATLDSWTRRGVLAAAAGAASVAAGDLALGASPAHAQTASATAVDAQTASAAAHSWKHAAVPQRGNDIAVKVGRNHEGRFGVMFKRKPRTRRRMICSGPWQHRWPSPAEESRPHWTIPPSWPGTRS